MEDGPLADLVSEAAARLGAAVDVRATGRGGLEALADTPPPDAALVDLPLADVRGAEVLAAATRLRLPVVAVSGTFRGPRAAGEVLRLGAADFFEKPFPVLSVMARLARLMGSALPGLEEPEDEVTGAAPLGPAPTGPLAVEPFLALALAGEGVPGVREAAAPPPLSELAAPLPDPLRPAAPRPAASPARRGDLASTGVVRLLVAVHQAQATGALTLSRGAVRKILVLEKGAPVYAASNVAAERFGAICVRRGIVSAAELEALRAAAPGARTGELLVARRKLAARQRAELIAAQVRAIAWSTFEWREGRYEFQLARPPAGLVALGLSLADLLLEGIVRTAGLERLRADLPPEVHLAPAPSPAFELYALGLRPAEAHLLSLADGTKSVRDLVALARLPEREALAFLEALREMGVLDDVERVLAGTRRIGFL